MSLLKRELLRRIPKWMEATSSRHGTRRCRGPESGRWSNSVALSAFRAALYGTLFRHCRAAAARPAYGSRACRRGPQSTDGAARVRRALGSAVSVRGGGGGNGFRGAPLPPGPSLPAARRRCAAFSRALSLGLVWGSLGNGAGEWGCGWGWGQGRGLGRPGPVDRSLA